MIAARLKHIFFTLLLTEILSLSAAFIICCLQVYRDETAISEHVRYLVVFLTPSFLLSLLGVMVVFYREVSRITTYTHSVTRSFLVKTLVVIISLGFCFELQSLTFSSSYAVLMTLWFFGLVVGIILATHWLTTVLMKRIYNHPERKLNVLAVGMNERAIAFDEILRGSPQLGASVTQYIDARQTADQKAGSPRYAGTLDSIEAILHDEVVDAVFIFLPVRTFYDDIQHVIEVSGFYGVPAHLIGNVFEAENVKKHAVCLNDFGNVAFTSITEDYFGLGVKRIFDVILSCLGLALLSPILLLVALYIKIANFSGTILFIQERAGLNKRIFRMYKFRTMVPGAEKMLDELMHLNEMDGAAFKITKDPRLIKGGGFIRRRSLDEFPQLFNVLIGDMSIVGPRPLPKRDYDSLSEDWQRKRFSMKPGLTCIWQVSGRNDVNFEEWMKMDLEYIDTWNLGLDAIIILKTIRELFRAHGR